MKIKTLFLALLILVSSCYGPGNPLVTRETGTLTFSGDQSMARTLYPHLSADDLIALVDRYEMEFFGSPNVIINVNKANVNWTFSALPALPSYTATIAAIPTGSYTSVNFRAKDAGGKVILAGSYGPITITNGANSMGTLPLFPVQTAGSTSSVTLKVFWPGTIQGSGLTAVDLQLTDSPSGVSGSYAGGVNNIETAGLGWTATPGSYNKFFSISGLTTGTYRIKLHFDGFTLPLAEILQVYDGVQNEFEWNLTSMDFGGIPTTPGLDPLRPQWERAKSPGGLRLFWAKDNSYKTGYQIERSSDDITYTLINTLPSNSTEYTDLLATPDIRYWYRIIPYTVVGQAVPLILDDVHLKYLSTPPTVIYVSDTGLDDTANLSQDGSTIPNAVRTLKRALQLAQDTTEIRLLGNPGIISYGGYNYVSKRVHIRGGWTTGFAGDTAPQTDISVLSDGLEVDQAAFGGFTALIRGVEIRRPTGEFSLVIKDSFLNVEKVKVVPPIFHPVTGGGILAVGPGYQLSFNELTVHYVDSSFDTRRYILSDGASLSIQNSKFLLAPVNSAFPFRGIEIVGNSPSLVLQDSSLDVGTSTVPGDGASFGLRVAPASGSPGLINVERNAIYLKGNDTFTATTDYATILEGAVSYKALFAQNYVQFAANSNDSPQTGLRVAAPAEALVYNNVFIAPNELFDATGIEDQGFQTRIYNNTFRIHPSSSSLQKWIGVDIKAGGHPRIVNNLFTGSNASGTTGLGVGIKRFVPDATTNPLEVRNNGFAGFGAGGTGYLLMNAGAGMSIIGVNDEGSTTQGAAGTASGNFSLFDGGSNWLPANSPHVNRAGAYTLDATAPPRVRWGGVNLTAAINSWGGSVPSLSDIETLLPTNATARRGSGGGQTDNWSIGADENNDGDFPAYSEWNFTSGSSLAAGASFSIGAIVNPDNWTFPNYIRKDKQESANNALMFVGNRFHIDAGALSSLPPALKFDAGWSVSLFYGDVVYKKGKLQTFIGTSDSEILGWSVSIDTNGLVPKLRIQANGIIGEADLPFWTLYRKWNHLLVSFDRSQHKLRAYINGNPTPLVDFTVGDALDFAFNDSANLLIGAKASGTDFFYGKIDDVKLFNRPVGSGELSGLLGVGDFSDTYTSSVTSWTPTQSVSPYTRMDLSWGSVPDNFGFLIKWKDSTNGLSGQRLLPPEAFGGLSDSLKSLSPGSYDLEFYPLNNSWGNLRDTVKLTNVVNMAPDPDNSLVGLWTFGDNEGKNLMAPAAGLQTFGGNHGNEWWAPSGRSHRSDTGLPDPTDFWQNDRINPGSVWYDGNTYLQTAGIVSALDPDGATSYAVFIRFTLPAQLSLGDQSLFQVEEINGTSAFGLRLTSDGTTDRLKILTDNGTNFSLQNFNSARLAAGVPYVLMVNYDPTTQDYDFYFSDGVSPNLGIPLAWNSGILRQQLKLGYSSAGNFRGFIDELRIYKNRVTIDVPFFSSLVNE